MRERDKKQQRKSEEEGGTDSFRRDCGNGINIFFLYTIIGATRSSVVEERGGRKGGARF